MADKARRRGLCSLLRARSRWRSLVSCPGPLPWFAPRRPHVLSASKRANPSPSEFGSPRGQRANSLMRRLHRGPGTASAPGPSRPGLCAPRADGGLSRPCVQECAPFFDPRHDGSLLRYPLQPMPASCRANYGRRRPARKPSRPRFLFPAALPIGSSRRVRCKKTLGSGPPLIAPAKMVPRA